MKNQTTLSFLQITIWLSMFGTAELMFTADQKTIWSLKFENSIEIQTSRAIFSLKIGASSINRNSPPRPSDVCSKG